MIIDLPVPTEVVFGRGSSRELGVRTRVLGGHAIVVTGRHALRRAGVLDALLNVLHDAGVRTTTFDAVSPDPKASEVDTAVAIATREGCDVVIGLGGGSAIDAAKAIAVGLRFGPIGPLVGQTLDDADDLVPVVAVPTTAGSGAEVTKGSIITDTERNLKSGIRGTALFPKLAIVDPSLLATVPPAVAVESGFDALAHAVEGYLARRSTEESREFSVRALGILGTRLPEVAAGRVDDAVLDDMAMAALLGGANVALASTCLPHRLQQAIGSVPGVPISHGRGLAAVYPAWIDRVRPHAVDKLDDVARILGHDDPGEAIATLRRTAGLEADLREHGFEPKHIDDFVAAVTGNLDNDPIPDPDTDLLREIYERSFTR